ncbi:MULTISPECIES: adenylate/guanylate cyclase domain-containing protein [unclassified Thalassospira]|uniref:adenylate/guanylate cyclase domain-containing protein n=1 Tax=unclassified Thalassospira TaxID=2648997 RepID=UPI000A1FB1EA|nr:adenylate/guanylate cyclase domain-containing protein [Thalassospira sp. MCCC 1A01428]OSQ39959.1 guanylate cyclase [Thalassospira sp. MCCC 1A01428]
MNIKRRFSVLTVLLTSFLATSIGGVGLALYLGLGAAYENTRNLWVLVADNELVSLQRAMGERMDNVGARANWVASQVTQGRLDPDFDLGWDNTMRALAADEMNVMAYGLVNGDREFTGYNPRDMTEIHHILPVDDMLISEISQLRGPTNNRTSFPRWDPYFKQPVIVDWVPLFRDGHYLGVFVQYLSLSNLSHSLVRGRENAPGVPFIIIAGNRVLAHPMLQSWGDHVASALSDGADQIERSPVPLPRTVDIGDPVLAGLGQSEKLDYPAYNKGTTTSNVQLSGLNIGGTYSVIVTKQLDNTPFSPLILGIHFEESLFDAEFDRLVLTAILGGIVLLLSIVLAVFMSRHFTRPIRRFATAARSLEAGHLDMTPILTGSRIREYDDAARSFNHMIIALRDRDRISSLFGKFLPPSIARDLLASETDSGVLPPQQRDATVLFVDIVGFTTMCEQLDPARIVAMLNAYFDTVTNIIEEHGGIITQFQGDAVLAVYNAFDELNDHADAALDTAIKIQQAVQDRLFDGQEITCRCGINTGRMIAGNVGATDRLSFTVHGDAVNSASRLEAENKRFGTKILLADSTRNQLSNPDRVIVAGDILLRGRSQTTAVYTVASDTRS